MISRVWYKATWFPNYSITGNYPVKLGHFCASYTLKMRKIGRIFCRESRLETMKSNSESCIGYKIKLQQNWAIWIDHVRIEGSRIAWEEKSPVGDSRALDNHVTNPNKLKILAAKSWNQCNSQNYCIDHKNFVDFLGVQELIQSIQYWSFGKWVHHFAEWFPFLLSNVMVHSFLYSEMFFYSKRFCWKPSLWSTTKLEQISLVYHLFPFVCIFEFNSKLKRIDSRFLQ